MKADAELSYEESKLLEEIYLKYTDQIYYLAYRYLKDKNLAEDIVHDTILRIAEKIKKKEITSCHKLGSLIGYIVKGLCVDKIRRESKVIYREIYDYELQTEDLVVSDVILNDSINKLPEKHREVFIMNFIEGRSYLEIAKVLNISEAAARKRMERAKIYLKNLWGGRDE